MKAEDTTVAAIARFYVASAAALFTAVLAGYATSLVYAGGGGALAVFSIVTVATVVYASVFALVYWWRLVV